jgi:predicted alpha/beta-hydrolase family hydrolase
VIAIDTAHGEARVYMHEAEGATAAVVLGHGAGGGVGARDLEAARNAALAQDVTVALVEQPYRVAGRKSSPPANQLDTSWIAVMEHLAGNDLAGLRLITGGRSAGARVACRTAAVTGATAVLCLAFPLQPPARKGKEPRPSRLEELQAVTVPMLIVQGVSDQFGMPPEDERWTVVKVAGNHSLRSDLPAVAAGVGAWLPAVSG